MRDVSIYKITNTINGKAYVGKTVEYETRMITHKSASRNPSYPEYTRPLYVDIREYGWENFSCEVIETCKEDVALERENYYIDFYDSNENGYNLFGGSGGLSQEVRDRMSKSKEFNYKSSLTHEEVVYIRKAYLEGRMPSDVYTEFKHKITHYYSFMNIWSGSRYAYVMPEVFDIRPNRVKLNYEKAEEIRELYETTELTYQKIADMYGIGKMTVRDVVKYRTWKNP